jgi:hypothetical protein
MPGPTGTSSGDGARTGRQSLTSGESLDQRPWLGGESVPVDDDANLNPSIHSRSLAQESPTEVRA